MLQKKHVNEKFCVLHWNDVACVHQDYQTSCLKATDPFIIMDWKEYLIYVESESFGSMNRRKYN